MRSSSWRFSSNSSFKPATRSFLPVWDSVPFYMSPNSILKLPPNGSKPPPSLFPWLLPNVLDRNRLNSAPVSFDIIITIPTA